jgi:putative ABC transport system substrate-binding protein
MRRREFITLLGGAAVAWPLTASAQQSAMMPVIGFVSGRSPGSDAYLVEGFRRGLRENGFTEGQNVALEFRWADGWLDRLPAMTAELIERKVAVLFAGAADVAPGALRVAQSRSSLATGSDPVETGLVASLNRPGGNLTGVSVSLLQHGRNPARRGEPPCRPRQAPRRRSCCGFVARKYRQLL